MQYKLDFKEVMERYRTLEKGEMKNRILARVHGFNENWIYPLIYCPDMEKMFFAWDNNLRFFQALEDDSIPVARPTYGSNMYGGFFGARVKFSSGYGGWSEAILDEWSKLDRLKFDEENYWIQKIKKSCDYFAKGCKDKFGLALIETIDALNFAVTLRGATRAYLDLYLYPDELCKLMDFALDFNIRLIEMQREIINTHTDWVFTLDGHWFSDRPVWLSVDAYASCSSDTYQKFGLNWTQKLIDHFGGGWMHLHTRGLHLLPEVVKLKNLVGIQIADDPNQPGAFDSLDRIRRITGDLPLNISCGFEEFMTGLENHTLPGGVIYDVMDHTTPKHNEDQNAMRIRLPISRVNKLMDKVREYCT